MIMCRNITIRPFLPYFMRGYAETRMNRGFDTHAWGTLTPHAWGIEIGHAWGIKVPHAWGPVDPLSIPLKNFLKCIICKII